MSALTNTSPVAAVNSTAAQAPGAAMPQAAAFPMFRAWVPGWIRPWLLCLLALSFQSASGVYLGGMAEQIGSRSLMREDLLMCLYATLCGTSMTFPILFRHKFTYTNKSLLLVSALGIVACDIIAMHATSLPLIWAVCLLTGAFKIQGTFECLSNLRLWFTPKADPRVFFPCIHIFIMGAVALSDFLAIYLCYFATWHYMTYLMMGVMLVNALWISLLLRHFHIPSPFPRLPLDWLGAVLWILFIMQSAYIFCYGEYYNWWDSEVIRTLAVTTVATLVLVVIEMFMHPAPYISPSVWRVGAFPALILFLLLIEFVLASETILEDMYFGGVMGWDEHTRNGMHLAVGAGVLAGCAFCLVWMKVLGWGKIRLVAFALSMFLAYAIYFYTHISSEAALSSFAIPVFLRSFASTSLSIVLLVCLVSIMDFMRLFQSLALFQAVHIVIGTVIGGAIIAFATRYLMSDAIVRYASSVDAMAVSQADIPAHIGGIMNQCRLATVKQIYGIVIYAAISLIALLLVYDIPLTRWLTSRLATVKGK